MNLGSPGTRFDGDISVYGRSSPLFMPFQVMVLKDLSRSWAAFTRLAVHKIDGLIRSHRSPGKVLIYVDWYEWEGTC
jgi:hypothetical protein